MSRQDRSGNRARNRKPTKRLSDGSPVEESQPEQKIKPVEDPEPKYTAPVTNENIQPINNNNNNVNNNTMYQTPVKEEIKYDSMTVVDHSVYNPPLTDYNCKMPLYYPDYHPYTYPMQPPRTDYEIQYPVGTDDYHIDHKDTIPQVELYNAEPYNHEYTVTELQPMTNVKVEPNGEEIGEMTLSQQTDKWISALALVELSHADL